MRQVCNYIENEECIIVIASSISLILFNCFF